ncbi:MAG: OsmC family protein [Bacteroidales bacterium]|nr:OsmC family protein [Bacteroidales bacterium]
MKASIDLKWVGNMSFETQLNGHKLVLDASPEVGGENKGPRPKPLMMVALAGCTGMDVVSLLKKMRVDIEGVNIKVEGDITEDHPKHFTRMKIIYEFTGNNLDIEKLEKAVNMSKEQYCGVSASYAKAMELTHEIRIA